MIRATGARSPSAIPTGASSRILTRPDSLGHAEPAAVVIGVEYAENFRNQDVVLAAMNGAGVAALWGAMADARRTGTAHLVPDGAPRHEFVVESGAAEVIWSPDRVLWRVDEAKLTEFVQKLGVLLGTDRPGHHYVDDMHSPAETVVLSRDEYV